MPLKRHFTSTNTRTINRKKKEMKPKVIPTLDYGRHPREQTTQSILQDFVDHTTLLGVQHCVRKKSVLWLFAYVCCIIMSIVQTWDTAVNFFQEKSSQTYLIGNKRALPFPSVTICPNVVLPSDFDFSIVPGYDISVDESSDDICNRTDKEEEEWESRKQANIDKIAKFIRKLPEKERKKYSISFNDLVLSCTFGGKPCNDSYIYQFNNPFYGNCFTFNPAFEENSGLITDIQDKLKLMMKITPGFQLIGAKRTIGVLIHAPGTAPILDLPSVQDIAGGYNTDLALTIGERRFLPKKSVLNSQPRCVDGWDQVYRRRSRYYNETSQYLYSVEACMKSCEQDYVGRQCNLTLASLPVLNAAYESTVNASFPIDCDIEDLDMEICGCPLPCHIVKYIINSDTTDIFLPDCELQKNSHSTKDAFKQQKVKVGVYFLTNIFESIDEELQYTLSEFLGFLGGNMSLWIGLCILSILELIELIFNLIVLWIRQRKNKKISSYNKSKDRMNSLSSTRIFNTYEMTSIGRPTIIRESSDRFVWR